MVSSLFKLYGILQCDIFTPHKSIYVKVYTKLRMQINQMYIIYVLF